MRSRHFSGALVVAVAGMVLAGSAGFSATASTRGSAGSAANKSASLKKTYPSALTPAQIAQYSASQTEKVIIVLANQHSDVPGSTKSTAARAAALATDQRPIVNELKTLKSPNLHSYSFVNAVSATVSHDEAVRLAANPAVSAVVPDVKIAATPSAPTPAPATASAHAAAVAAPAVIPTPAPGLCPTNPAQPILEPEALQLMNVNFGAGSSQPSASQLADGTGVKVAVFPDGLDPNIPDFIRNGHSAIFDYQDFTGEGTGAVTGAEEAFGDASSIISQGNQTFDLSGEVNPAHPLPAGCNIQIKGVAPGADLAVMKVFGDSNSAFNSEILQGLDYAVNVDHVDILSESFGGNPIPNAPTDPTAIFDADAVAAGITVVVSSGDAGNFNTIGTPATDPAVISAAATTSFRAYAQAGFFGYGEFGDNGFLSNSISTFSSDGFTEYGPRTADVAAPGEAGWSDCSANTAVFTECRDIFNGPNPQPIVQFGGTSQSAPLTAGTAALVIEAYRNTHGGATPNPGLVKQILKSSAQDVDARGDFQGAGLIDALRAVQTAESVSTSNGAPAPVAPGLLYSPTAISATGIPNHTTPVQISVTNTGSSARTISPTLRVLGPPTTLKSGTLTLSQAHDPTFINQLGATVGDVHTVTFTVPAGVDQLESRTAWLTNGAVNGSSIVRETLFDPSGKIASDSRPQGVGAGFGDAFVTKPAAGAWTLLIFETAPYNGPLSFAITGSTFKTVPSGVVPASRTIAPGASAPFVVETVTPSAPGDQSESVVFADSSNSGPPLGTIPVLLRAQIPVHPSLPGSFSGTLTGGNGRQAFYGQELAYQFVVPAGITQINANVTVGAAGYQVLAFFADPNQVPADVQSTTDGTTNLQTVHLSWHNPIPGTWNLDLATLFGSSSALTSTTISGEVDFAAPTVTATGLPFASSTHLASGVPVTATVKITNNGNSPEAYSIDPRLNTSTNYSLASINATGGLPLPVSDPSTVPQFIVPPFSTHLDVAALSTVPITMSTSPDFGTPEVEAGSFGPFAEATLNAPDIPASIWGCPPSEVGPFPSGAVSTTFACGADATTATFDPAVDSATGNIWSALEGLTPNYAPLVLGPGQSGTITVTITPSGHTGAIFSGSLAVETFSFFTVSSDLVASLPYTYKIG
jgi:hypothetical protein